MSHLLQIAFHPRWIWNISRWCKPPVYHGFHEFWGYLYHLDAMQGVSFPDINKTPTDQTFAPPCKNTSIPGLAEVPGAVDPAITPCLTPPRPVLLCTSSDGTSANQKCQDQGPLTLERSKTVDEEISSHDARARLRGGASCSSRTWTLRATALFG